jgi:hypothetical protein
MTVLARVAELRAAGREVISLCAGEPSQGAPSPVRRRMAELMTEPIPLGYSESFGIRPLRERLAGHYARWYGLEGDPARIAITTGSSGAFLHTFLAAFDPGDRVLLARPGYPAYRNILASHGCTVVELDCGPELRECTAAFVASSLSTSAASSTVQCGTAHVLSWFRAQPRTLATLSLIPGKVCSTELITPPRGRTAAPPQAAHGEGRSEGPSVPPAGPAEQAPRARAAALADRAGPGTAAVATGPDRLRARFPLPARRRRRQAPPHGRHS